MPKIEITRKSECKPILPLIMALGNKVDNAPSSVEFGFSQRSSIIDLFNLTQF